MQEFIDSITRSLSEKNYHSAMFIALSLPDICGSLETPNERNGIRAKRWYTENLGYKYCPENQYEALLAIDPERLQGRSKAELEMFKNHPIEDIHKLDASTYWKLRNSFMHEASDQAGDLKVHLTHSDAHMNFILGALQLSIMIFAKDMVEAANKWIERMREKPDVWSRIESTAKVRNSILNGTVLFG